MSEGRERRESFRGKGVKREKLFVKMNEKRAHSLYIGALRSGVRGTQSDCAPSLPGRVIDLALPLLIKSRSSDQSDNPHHIRP